MAEEKIENLLNELADATEEPARSGLAADIKHQIPQRLMRQRKGMSTVNIIIDLRVNRVVAAAVIILTVVLCASFLGGDSTGGGIYQDWKILMKSFGWADAGRSSMSAVKSKYEDLVDQGKEVVYYGNNIDLGDSDAVLLQWKLSEGKYNVLFADFRMKEVSAEELIKLQARMLQKKAKQ
jgi:hypothetical protein